MPEAIFILTIGIAQNRLSSQFQSSHEMPHSKAVVFWVFSVLQKYSKYLHLFAKGLPYSKGETQTAAASYLLRVSIANIQAFRRSFNDF